MTIPSTVFLLALFVVSAFFFWIPAARARRGVLAALNLSFLAAIVPNVWSWVALGVFLGSGYAMARWLAVRPSRLLLAAYLVVLVVAFLLLKKYTLLRYVAPGRWMAHPVAVVGLSYMLFRQIHFLVDAAQAQIREFSVWKYLQYQISLFTILAGPIQRYPSFAAQWDASEPVLRDREELFRAYLRILTGILSMTVLATAAHAAYGLGVHNPQWSRLLRAPLVFYAYPAYVYFNFAGYCSVVIGAAGLLGIRVPENFNRPYVARNMIDYWNRWHITLSHWLRDYLFTPMYKSLAVRFPARAASVATPCFFVVFLVAGIWHGTTANFVVFGLLNGLGVAGAKAWENHLVKRRGRAGFREYMASRPIGACARVLNFHFASATFLFFPQGLRHCLDVIRSVVTGTPVS